MRAGLVAVFLRYESLSLSVFVHNSAVPGSRCPLTLTLAVSSAAAAAALLLLERELFQHGCSWRGSLTGGRGPYVSCTTARVPMVLM